MCEKRVKEVKATMQLSHSLMWKRVNVKSLRDKACECHVASSARDYVSRRSERTTVEYVKRYLLSHGVMN